VQDSNHTVNQDNLAEINTQLLRKHGVNKPVPELLHAPLSELQEFMLASGAQAAALLASPYDGDKSHARQDSASKDEI